MLDETDHADLRTFLDSRLQTLIADANEAGFATEDVLAGLAHGIGQLQVAYGEDPDPAEDPDLEASRAARVVIPDDILGDIETERGVPRAG